MERHIPRQGEPVELRHLTCHAGAGKGGSRIEAGGGSIEADQIEGIRRLRIIQLSFRTAIARDRLEADWIAPGQDSDESREGFGVNLAEVVVGKSLGKDCSLVRVARFVAVRAMWGRLIVDIRVRGLVEHTVRRRMQ